jgi:putative endonuclease
MKKEKYCFIYILASKRNGTLNIGVTNRLMKRTFQHKLSIDKDSFTAKRGVDKLVYYEIYDNNELAIRREK